METSGAGCQHGIPYPGAVVQSEGVMVFVLLYNISPCPLDSFALGLMQFEVEIRC